MSRTTRVRCEACGFVADAGERGEPRWVRVIVDGFIEERFAREGDLCGGCLDTLNKAMNALFPPTPPPS